MQLMLLITVESTKSHIKATCYNFIDDVVIIQHNTIYTNGSVNVTKLNKLVNFNDNNLFTK